MPASSSPTTNAAFVQYYSVYRAAAWFCLFVCFVFSILHVHFACTYKLLCVLLYSKTQPSTVSAEWIWKKFTLKFGIWSSKHVLSLSGCSFTIPRLTTSSFLSTLCSHCLLIIKGWSNCQKFCSWFSCLCASAVHSPVVFSPMYCLHIVALVINQRRCKEGHNASNVPVLLRFSCPMVLWGLFPVLLFLFCYWITLSTPKEMLNMFNIAPFILSFSLFGLSICFNLNLFYSCIY